MKNNKTAQAFTEFVIIAPIILFILLGIVKIAAIAIQKQKLEMASYYAARLYSKYSIRGVKRGSIYAYRDKKDRILNEIIKPRVGNLLDRKDVQITNSSGNKIELVLPVILNFGVKGFWGINKEITLKASGEFENDSLKYGGGRSGEEILGMS